MKIKSIAVVAALAIAPGLASAFTLNFGSVAPGPIPSPLVVNIPGYGDVSFVAGFNAVTSTTSAPEVGTSFFGATSLQFADGDTVHITFLGGVPDSITPDSIALSIGTGEEFILSGGGTDYTITLFNSPDGAGLTSIAFDAVPEPSAAALGLLGAAGVLLRRRR